MHSENIESKFVNIMSDTKCSLPYTSWMTLSQQYNIMHTSHIESIHAYTVSYKVIWGQLAGL